MVRPVGYVSLSQPNGVLFSDESPCSRAVANSPFRGLPFRFSGEGAGVFNTINEQKGNLFFK